MAQLAKEILAGQELDHAGIESVMKHFIAPESEVPIEEEIDMTALGNALDDEESDEAASERGGLTLTATFGAGIASVDLTTASGAANAISTIDAALSNINSSRANLGAVQNRFSSVVSNLAATSENLTASRSRIMDTDFAAGTASLSRNQILQQAGTAMLAQANSLPQGVLALLRG